MMNKAVGYSGFRTYGELPYPTMKQGKDLEIQNKIWSSTVRAVDHVNPLQNYHNHKTVYKQSHLENTYPEHYHPHHVPKGGASTLKFDGTGTRKAYDQLEAHKYGGVSTITDPNNPTYDDRKNRPLKSGTEHWKSVYGHMTDGAGRGLNQTSGTGFGGRLGPGHSDALDGIGGTGDVTGAGGVGGAGGAGGPMGHTGRSASLNANGGKMSAQEMGRAKSYKKRAYINNAKLGTTEYKFNYGQKIGDTPLNLMNRVSVKQPLRDHPLKRGTNQLWSQIPNYQGFKPSQLSFKEYQERIEKRKDIDKGNLKLQTTENFLLQVPGYCGFRPQSQLSPLSHKPQGGAP